MVRPVRGQIRQIFLEQLEGEGRKLPQRPDGESLETFEVFFFHRQLDRVHLEPGKVAPAIFVLYVGSIVVTPSGSSKRKGKDVKA